MRAAVFWVALCLLPVAYCVLAFTQIGWFALVFPAFLAYLGLLMWSAEPQPKR